MSLDSTLPDSGNPEDMTETLLNEGQLPELTGTEDLVTVGVFPDAVTAHMARAVLESAGIPSFVHGENANSLLPVAFEARLQVRPQDEVVARDTINSADLSAMSEADVAASEEGLATRTDGALL